VLVSVAGGALAEEKPRALESGERATVSFEMLHTFTSGATSRVHMIPVDLSVGQAAVGDVMRGTPFSFGVGGDPSGCGSQSSFQSAESQIAAFPVAWSADARLLEASTDRLLLSVTWRRFERGSDGKAVEVASEDISSVELREGERVLLDLARPPGSTCFRNSALEITARLKEDPALAARQIAYDVWLVHEATGGKRTTARTQLTGSQGERLPFAFPKEKLPALASGGAADAKLQVGVSGDLRGRVRADGALELSLATERMLSYVDADGSNDGGVGEGGEKVVRVQPGESIRMELPGPANGPSRGDARVPRMSQDLAGHVFALIVTAKTL
jgi:hypothetical protein